MATSSRITDLFDNIPNSDDKLNNLQDLKTLLSAVGKADLKNIVPNLSFNVIFDCLNTNDGEQISVCSQVLDLLLQAVDPSIILDHFHNELLAGLGHPHQDVKKLCISQVLRVGTDFSQQVAASEEVLCQMVMLLADDDLKVAKVVTDALVQLGNNLDFVEALFSANVLNRMKSTIDESDTIRFRIYELIVGLACISEETMALTSQTGILQRLVNEVSKDDVLVQLNCLELLKDLALTEHGLTYLSQQGTIQRLQNMLNNVQSDPLAGFLLPGLMKFFGNVAYLHPKELNNDLHSFIMLVFQSLDNPDLNLQLIAMETIGHIGSHVDGKLALEKLGGNMNNACKKIGLFISNAPVEVKIKAILAINSLLNLQIADQTVELLGLTEKWYQNLGVKILENMMTITKQPFTEVRCASIGFFSKMAALPWGQHILNNHPGFNEYLLDRSTEKSKEGKEAKHDVVVTLVESPTSMDIFGRPYYVRLKEYANEGPFYVRTEAAVAMEGDGE